eukprot:jgi/Undpi1/8850/HiC_scaffold_25.g11312.m1
MRVVASRAAKALMKAAKRTARPGQIGEGVSQGAAGRAVAASRMRAINTTVGIKTHMGAATVLMANLAMISDATTVAPTVLETEEEDEDEDGGRRN